MGITGERGSSPIHQLAFPPLWSIYMYFSSQLPKAPPFPYPSPFVRHSRHGQPTYRHRLVTSTPKNTHQKQTLSSAPT